MQPVRLKRRDEERAVAPASGPQAALGQPPRRRGFGSGGSSRGRGGLLPWSIAIAACLAAGATGYLLHREKGRVAALEQEQAFLQSSYDEKLKALQRRLVGAIMAQGASPGVPAQPGQTPTAGGGAQDHLADLITRQIELEARQALLGALAGQAVGPVLPQGGAQAPGGNQFAGESSIIDKVNPAVLAQQRRQVAAQVKASEALSLDQRITLLGQSLDRVENGQSQQIAGLGRQFVGRVQEVRVALGEVGLDPAKVKLPAARAGMGGPLVPLSASIRPGSFEHALMQLNQARSVYGRWRDLATIVPFQRPLEGDDSTTSNFGPRSDPFTGQTAMHAGMDFRGETGTPVRAGGAGQVLRAEVSGGYGNLVELDHGNGVTTRYAHLSAFDVKPGQLVAAGQVIGRVGSTGRSTGPHLHYETRLSDQARNPLKFIEIGDKLSVGLGGVR
ncbi:MAG TPA: M23 family metallopeptidase [Bosea sp. (in: a-proteobacteria)]|jgi:murein DD-endopeptidase MepM/ murein hydrolase activator NlpD|uniref:M23 family metallopeptidase n=1 Tax=Bosea sp. (in: a-proteobacteria) TaxID=1871050 RepID=UPI002E1266F5|nr:M23 family metallopeptidase [Bosea sp. (in: a-proteobacteria)]